MYNNLHYFPDCIDCILNENRNEIERVTRTDLT